jgi:hypothetical protein
MPGPGDEWDLVVMLVCGDTRNESREAYSTLYTELMGRTGLAIVGDDGDYIIGVLGLLQLKSGVRELAMLYVDDVMTPPESRSGGPLLVLVYAGKQAGVGNLPQLEKSLKTRKHEVKLPKMISLRLDQVLLSPSDEKKRDSEDR